MSYFVLILMLSVLPGFIITAHVEREHGKLDVAKIASSSTFYDTKTNQTLSTKRPSKPGNLALTPFGSTCSCAGIQCRCCTGIRIYGFGLDREACAVLTYKQEDSKLDLDLRMNNNSLRQNNLSARDQQLCLPVVPISIVGPVDWCVKLQNTSLGDQNTIMNTCLSMLVRFSQNPFLTLRFNCMDLGVPGININGPEVVATNNSQSTVIKINNDSTTTSYHQDSDVMDTVTQNTLREYQPETSIEV